MRSFLARTWAYLRSRAARHWESLFLLVVLVLLAVTSAYLGDLYRAATKEFSVGLRVRYYALLRLQQAMFGATLGLGRLFVERRKPGRWSVDFVRLAAALPAAVVALLMLTTPYLMDTALHKWLIDFRWWGQGTFEASATILLGFLVITSLRKRRAAAGTQPMPDGSSTVSLS